MGYEKGHQMLNRSVLFIALLLMPACAIGHHGFAIPPGSTKDAVAADYDACWEHQNPYKSSIFYGMESEASMNECMRNKGYRPRGVRD